MKIKYLPLLGIIAVFAGCSSAYRIGQTPDDVYYSPAPPHDEYVTSNNQQDKDSYTYNNTYNSEDLAIRRGISDPRYRSNISLDFGYGYDPYMYGSSFYSPYSYYNPYAYTGVTFYPYNYNYYNNYYSPYYNYYYPLVYYISKPGNSGNTGNYSGPRRSNLGVYNTNNINRGNTSPVRTTNTNANSVPARTFQTPAANNRSGVGNLIRRVFTPNNDNNNRTYNNNNNRTYNNNRSSNNDNNVTPARTFQPATSTPSNSSNNSPSSSGSSSAPVRTFRK